MRISATFREIYGRSPYGNTMIFHRTFFLSLISLVAAKLGKKFFLEILDRQQKTKWKIPELKMCKIFINLNYKNVHRNILYKNFLTKHSIENIFYN